MQDILAVCLNKTYKENMSDEKLKEITSEWWRIGKNNFDNLNYIVGVKSKSIKSVYAINKEKSKYERNIYNGTDAFRYKFELEEIEEEIKEKIIKTFDNNIVFGRGTAIKYLNSEDLKEL